MMALVAVGCAKEPGSILGEGPRFPDVEGAVQQVTLQSITIGGKAYPLDEGLESFTSRGHDVAPVLGWKDKYIHLGLDEDTKKVVWIAGIGVIAKTSDPPTAIYVGIFESMSEGRAVFRDGTTLKLAPEVAAPVKGRETVVTIDVAKKMAISATSTT